MKTKRAHEWWYVNPPHFTSEITLMLTQQLAYVNNLCYYSYVMSKTETSKSNLELLPEQEFGAPTIDVHDDDFTEHGLRVNADPALIARMMAEKYGMSPDEISRTHITVAPPDRRSGHDGQYSRGVVSGTDDSGSEFGPLGRNLIKIGVRDPGDHNTPSRDQERYIKTLLHEASHNADDARGEIGSVTERRVRKIGGAILGAALGGYIQSKLGIPITKEFARSSPVFEGVYSQLERQLQAAVVLGGIALGAIKGVFLGYRSQPTERRAYRNMNDPQAIEEYGDMITVEEVDDEANK